MNNILLFGGSFDPIHHGHLIIGRHVAEYLDLARVILIPSANPPHKQGQQLAPAADRLEMCRLAAADDPQFEVSDWEIGQAGPNYTLYTIQHFQAAYGADTKLYWLVGMDSLNELDTWYRVDELVNACTIVTAARPGFEPPDGMALSNRFSPPQIAKLHRHVVEGPRIDIAGTEIRARVRAGRSIRYLVPEPVWCYIEERGLYREA
ncbi:MAG: nicotinate (nicotinamide) nucleotide adenylyltransferase [Phycisphaerae bacterium]|nr:nicotinate (nicotinamide) nucleotide adenylyltransferase [Phycisphaerae bacterium]